MKDEYQNYRVREVFFREGSLVRAKTSSEAKRIFRLLASPHPENCKLVKIDCQLVVKP